MTDDLRALAEAANRPAPHYGLVIRETWEAQQKAFRDAANPAVVLALLDKADRLAEADRVMNDLLETVQATRSERNDWKARAEVAEAELASLIRYVESLTEQNDDADKLITDVQAERDALAERVATLEAEARDWEAGWQAEKKRARVAEADADRLAEAAHSCYCSTAVQQALTVHICRTEPKAVKQRKGDE